MPGGAKLHFYPLQNLILDAFADAAVTVAGDDVTITGLKHESLTEAPTEFAGLIVAETGTGKSGFRVSTAGAAAGTAATQATSATTEETAPGSGTE